MKTNKYGIHQGRHTPGELRRRLVEEFRGAGKTQAEFCRKRGLNPKTFGRWVGVSSKEAGGAEPAFTEVCVSEPPRPSAGAEILLPSGIVVRLPVACDVGALINDLLRREGAA